MILLVLACALISDADLAARFDVDGDGIARPDDCDDRDAAVGDATSWHVDADGDGFGGEVEGTDCAPGVGYVADGTDCDDANSAANPEAEERCDAIDNDCDGATDEDSAVDAPTWYRDADGDTYGVTDDALVSCGAPAGSAATPGDCNDADATVNPGVREACDGRDEDCSGVVDDPYWWRDADEDGYGDPGDSTIACEAPGGYVEYGTDCDDVDAAVNPGADEVCDDADVDEDCDGSSDDADDDVVGRVAAYADDDGDGWGNPERAVPPACELTSGYSWTDTDCDDTRADVNPAATEACYDDLDQDCDGASDDDCDLEGSSTGATAATTVTTKTPRSTPRRWRHAKTR